MLPLPKKNKFNGSNLWDKENSTFIQRIVLRGNRREFLGYSKKIDYHERNDKDSLLINWIIRMYECGYLDQHSTAKDAIEFIEYYRNDKPDATFIVRLYYKYPEWNPQFLDNKRLVNFVNRFYAMIESGSQVKDIKKALYVQSRAKELDALDLDTHRFSNERHLANYCSDLLVKNIRPKGEVENFFIKYKEKFLTK